MLGHEAILFGVLRCHIFFVPYPKGRQGDEAQQDVNLRPRNQMGKLEKKKILERPCAHYSHGCHLSEPSEWGMNIHEHQLRW